MTCATCHQPILPGLLSDTFKEEDFHENPSDCVAATEAATARKCAEIAWERCRLLNGDAIAQSRAGRPEMANLTALKADQFLWTAKAIGRAYPKAFVQEEGV